MPIDSATSSEPLWKPLTFLARSMDETGLRNVQMSKSVIGSIVKTLTINISTSSFQFWIDAWAKDVIAVSPSDVKSNRRVGPSQMTLQVRL